MTSHGPPTNPGPGSPDVSIGFMPAWRALPASVGAAVDAISNAMDAFMNKPVLNPGSAGADIAKISQNLVQGGAKAAAAGAPAAAATAASQIGTLNATNVTLTATWTAASVVPGGQPAADQAFTQGIKAAAAVAASATLSAMASLADMHICPLPCPVPPHGPGFVTKGSNTVLINNLPPARQNDKIMEACGGSDPISMGCMTVEIGDQEGSGGGVAGAVAANDTAAQAESSAAALSDAAGAGTPLVEVCESCRQLQNELARGRPATAQQAQPAQAGTRQCAHPVNSQCQISRANRGYGIEVLATWESSTGNLADLADCYTTEHITYSRIPNPPFGQPPDGNLQAESGTSERIPSGDGVPGTDGNAFDLHRHPSTMVRRPPTVEDTYVVTQTYDYNCHRCHSGWVPFGRYTIRYRVYRNQSGAWRFEVRKQPGSGLTSDEAI